MPQGHPLDPGSPPAPAPPPPAPPPPPPPFALPTGCTTPDPFVGMGLVGVCVSGGGAGRSPTGRNATRQSDAARATTAARATKWMHNAGSVRRHPWLVRGVCERWMGSNRAPAGSSGAVTHGDFGGRYDRSPPSGRCRPHWRGFRLRLRRATADRLRPFRSRSVPAGCSKASSSIGAPSRLTALPRILASVRRPGHETRDRMARQRSAVAVLFCGCTSRSAPPVRSARTLPLPVRRSVRRRHRVRRRADWRPPQGARHASASREDVVVVAGDHGESPGEHGERNHGIFVYESVLRVPLIVRAPGVPATRVGTVVRLTSGAVPLGIDCR